MIAALHDNGQTALSDKLMKRPLILQRIREYVCNNKADVNWVHSRAGSRKERAVARKFGVPLYGSSLEGLKYGSKAYSRRLFRMAHLLHAIGTYSAVYTTEDVVENILQVRRKYARVLAIRPHEDSLRICQAGRAG